MVTRISPDVDNTERVLEAVLPIILSSEERVAFLVDAGQAHNVVARIRTMISRKRKALEARGKKPKRFRLCATWHPETHGGKRHDCIVLWREVNTSHMMREQLEDMLQHG